MPRCVGYAETHPGAVGSVVAFLDRTASHERTADLGSSRMRLHPRLER